MPPVPAVACEVGHIPPAWSEAGRALESPTEGRCVVATTPPAGRNVWSLCGGFELRRLEPTPGVCPAAPGGLAIKRIPSAPMYRQWGAADAAVVLDCPGRYEIAEAGALVTVKLADSGPSACAAVGREVNGGSVAGWPQVDPTGMSARPTKELPPEVSALLPDALRSGWVADTNYAGDTVSGVTAWESGTFSRRVAGFDLAIGRNTAWQALRFFVEDGNMQLPDAPVRVRATLLRDTHDKPVELATWATIGWTASESWLSDIVPVNLPESRACGAHVAAGTPSLIQTGEAPETERACRRPPATPADTVYIGRDWVYLDWNVVPEALRTVKRKPPNPNDWRAEEDNGCDIVCQ